MSRDRGGNAPTRQSEPNVVTLYGVRGSYLSIYEKRVWDNDVENAKYEGTWITPGDSKYYDDNLAAMQDAINWVLDNDKVVRGKGKKKGFIEPLFFTNEEDGLGEGYDPDSFFVKSKKNKKRPRVIDADGEPIDADDPVGSMDEPIKSGDFFDVILRLYGYDNKSIGINCEIMLVRFRKSGESIGSTGREYGSDDFAKPDDGDYERSAAGSSRRGRGEERGRGRGEEREERGRGRGEEREERSSRGRGRDRDEPEEREERSSRGRGRDEPEEREERGSRRGRERDADRDEPEADDERSSRRRR